MDQLPIFQPDQRGKKRPSFPEGLLVVLTKDYSQAPYNFSQKFKENDPCVVVNCGLSEYLYNEASQEFEERPNGTEWCSIELCCTDPEPPQCCVKFEDLRRLRSEEYEEIFQTTLLRKNEIDDILRRNNEIDGI